MGHIRLSLVLMEEIAAEWFHMARAVSSLCNLASTNTYLLSPRGATLMCRIWK